MSVPATSKSMLHQLHAQAERLKERPALWSKRSGTYQAISWRQYAQRVKDLAVGLASLGLDPGQSVVVWSSQREERAVAELAVMAMGGVVVALGTDARPQLAAQMARECGAVIAILERAPWVHFFRQTMGDIPTLRHLVAMEKSSRAHAATVSYAELLERGSAGDDAEYYARVEQLAPSSAAKWMSIGGAGGGPLQRLCFSHQHLLWTAAQLSTCLPLGEADVLLAYQAHRSIADDVLHLYVPLLVGAQLYFAESFEKYPLSLREVRPTLFAASALSWAKMRVKLEALTRVLPAHRRRLLVWAQGVARNFHSEAMSHRQAPVAVQAQYALASQFVLKPLKERLGLDCGRLLLNTGSPMPGSDLEFFAAHDIVLAEMYGTDECTGYISVSTPTAIKFGAQGRPLPGVEVRITQGGTIQVRGNNVATADLRGNDRWLELKETGALDEEGFLRVRGAP